MFKYRHQSKLEQQRQKLLPIVPWSSSLSRYLETPLPNPKHSIDKLDLIALDFETSGLDNKHDKILSIGTIALGASNIQVSSVREIIVNHAQFVQPSSAVVNELTPKHLQAGIPIDAAMDNLFNLIRGKVVVAHGAQIEKRFIDTYVYSRYQLSSLPCFYLDTIDIEKRFSFKGKKKLHTSYNLTQLRDDYGLPRYSEHSAGIDALSCAELFLLQTKKLKLTHHHPTSQKLIARL
jgi:DNA polymerase-3 subunit epsilon